MYSPEELGLTLFQAPWYGVLCAADWGMTTAMPVPAHAGASIVATDQAVAQAPVEMAQHAAGHGPCWLINRSLKQDLPLSDIIYTI